MASASRVPLLVKSRGRTPARVSIAPRSQPSNGPRAKRATPSVSDNTKDNVSEMLQDIETQKPAEESSAIIEKTPTLLARNVAHSVTPAVKMTISKPTNGARSVTGQKSSLKPSVMARPVVNNTSAADCFTARSSAVQLRPAGEISVGGSLSAPPPSAKSPGIRPVLTVRSPVVLPVQQRLERLVKISSAGPVYRASPAMRPRAGSIGSSPAIRPRGGSISSSPAVASQDLMKQRLLRKLEIKPHQSPRRSAMQLQQQNLRNQDGPASPLLLGGKPSEIVPDVQLDAQQSKCVDTSKTTGALAVPAKTKRPVAAKRRKSSENTSVQTNANASMTVRRSLRRKAKRPTYRETGDSGSSDNEPDHGRHEDVNPNDLDLPEDEMNMYVPARERATMWAKSLLRDDDAGKKGDKSKEGGASQAMVMREKKTSARRNRSESNSASASSIVTGIGGGMMSRRKMEELLKKEPSQMTMGELAMTVPKGRRIERYEREEAASDTLLSAVSSGDGSSNLLKMDAFDRVRSLSVSSESAAFAGSLVTPQVKIIDGQMVVLENTIKLGDELQRTSDALGEGSIGGENTGLPPRHSSSRYNSSPGKRWGKEETKQFYYCLSQVGPNFSMMATLFPTRKRKELKSKFKYEEKNHAKLIEIALRASTAPLDSEMVDVISQMVDKEAQRGMLKAQTKKRKARSPQDLPCSRQDDDDTASVVGSMGLSPMSTPQVRTEEFVETLNDEDLFPSSRHDSFDFSG